MKSDPLLLGLDLGTTNAKAVIYNLRGEAQVASTRSYPTHYPRPAWAEQRPSDWLESLEIAAKEAIGRLGSRAENIAGIGLSAHGPGLILVDDHYQRLLETSPIWQDEQCSAQGHALLEKLGTIWPGLGSPLYSFPAKLLWAIENEPDAAHRARYALGIKDVIVHWLTGEIATEPSSGPGQLDWYAPVFDACGWSLDRLPPVIPSTSRVGWVKPELGLALGIPADMPVIMGLNDGASATLSSGVHHAGDVIITLSTNGVLRLSMKEPLPPEVRMGHSLFNWPYIEDLWIAGGQTKAGGSSLRWLVNLIAGSDEDAAFEELLAAAAAAAPGTGGVIFLPYLIGRGSPRSDAAATGVFTGLALNTGRGDLTRAVLEGVAFALRDIFDDFTRMNHSIGQIHLSGGGARSALWREIIANVLGHPLKYYATDSTLGAAMVAAIGLSLHPDFATAAAEMTRSLGEVTPSEQLMAAYAAQYDSYQDVRDTLYP